MPDFVELIAVQLPGRVGRFKERPFTQMDALVDALVPHFESIGDLPYAFFGHSLGALVAYEVACRLSYARLPTPYCLYISGSAAPHATRINNEIYRFADQEFIDYLHRIQGIPGEILADSELMQLLLPTMRADFQIASSYNARSYPRLECNLTAYRGDCDDEVKDGDIELWSEYVSGIFQMHILPGGHFFINSAREQLLSLLEQDCQRAVVAGEITLR